MAMDAGAIRMLLRDAQSMAPETIKKAEASLQVAESQPGFGYLLAQLISSQNIPQSDRQLSAILLRKFVRAHWDGDAEGFQVRRIGSQRHIRL